MTKQDRTTLKSFFRDGALPTAEHYRDLIDSGVNQVEDGFQKTPEEGLRLESAGSSLRVLSLYEGLGTATPSWTFEHGSTKDGKDKGALHFKPMLGDQAERNTTDSAEGAGADKRKVPVARKQPATGTASPPGKKKQPDEKTAQDSVAAEAVHGAEPQEPSVGLYLTRDGRLGVNTVQPAWRLDVDGVARMAGRIGVSMKDTPHVPANGKWHDITDTKTGCQAFEVMAGAGGAVNDGHYAMLHAIAMNAFHPRNKILNWIFGRRSIRAQTAVYGSYSDRLRLRWVKDDKKIHHFRLQVKSSANYGAGKKIHYYLTRLWFDEMMEGSRDGDNRDEGLL